MEYKLHETHGHLDLLLQRMGILESRDTDPDGDFEIKNFDQARIKAQEMLQNHTLFIQPTVSTHNFSLNQRLWKGIDTIKLLIGAHPEIVDDTFIVSEFISHQNEVLANTLENPAWNTKVIGFGECGLDYYYSQDKQIHAKQQSLFVEQLMKAINLDLPVVIHCRDAFDDLFAILKEFPQIHGKFDIHCYTGDRETARKALELGAYFGIGGIATFKNGETLRDAIDYIPVQNLLIETDLPFLAPVPHRGKDCIPEYIDDVASVLADLKSLDIKQLWDQLYSNTTTLYSL